MSRRYGTAEEIADAEHALAAAEAAEDDARARLADLYRTRGRQPAGFDAAQSALAFASMVTADARARLALVVPLDGKRQRPPRQPLRDEHERTTSTRRRRASTPHYFRSEISR